MKTSLIDLDMSVEITRGDGGARAPLLPSRVRLGTRARASPTRPHRAGRRGDRAGRDSGVATPSHDQLVVRRD